ncbi:hypothetical protein RR46_02604 [Papilio xuthus]|uniref:Uncharacterized protein n=1 Tax=Papilio xuthus TaxID=66420 RepID=A0A194Q8F8_PAPXU|nr:hypothetical protein RR46_02604 [Papilio xuthus]
MENATTNVFLTSALTPRFEEAAVQTASSRHNAPPARSPPAVIVVRPAEQSTAPLFVWVATLASRVEYGARRGTGPLIPSACPSPLTPLASHGRFPARFAFIQKNKKGDLAPSIAVVRLAAPGEIKSILFEHLFPFLFELNNACVRVACRPP